MSGGKKTRPVTAVVSFKRSRLWCALGITGRLCGSPLNRPDWPPFKPALTHRRERVITVKEQELYLGAAAPLLHDVSVVLFDTGVRPEECHCLRWENITWD